MDITIRHSSKEDAASIKAIYEQPSCYSGTLQLPYPSLEKWEKFVGNPPENFYSLVAECQGKVLGQIGMEVYTNPRRKHAANIGMGVSEAAQSSGVGTVMIEAMLDLAFNWLALKRIELSVYTDNPGAIHLYKKFGFEVEGTCSSYAFRDGDFVDVYLMSRVQA